MANPLDIAKRVGNTEDMTKTLTTAQAAKVAEVTTRTIRRWATANKVSAVKNTAGRWEIDAVSLHTHIAATIADRADYTGYKDLAKARDNVYNLVADGSIIPLIEGCYLVVSKTTDGITYVLSTIDQTCDCKGQANWGRCSHLTAANAIEARKPAAPTALPIAA